MSEIDVQVRSEPWGAMLVLSGELDMSTAPAVEQRLKAAEGTGAATVVLDLRDLSFLDSSGLRLITEADKRARSAGRRLALVRGPEVVNRVFEITGLDDRLDVVDDPAQLAG